MLGRPKDLGQRPGGQKVAFSIPYRGIPHRAQRIFPALFGLVLRAISRIPLGLFGLFARLIANGAPPDPFRRDRAPRPLRS